MVSSSISTAVSTQFCFDRNSFDSHLVTFLFLFVAAFLRFIHMANTCTSPSATAQDSDADDINPADYIPVHKEVVIGLSVQCRSSQHFVTIHEEDSPEKNFLCLFCSFWCGGPFASLDNFVFSCFCSLVFGAHADNTRLIRVMSLDDGIFAGLLPENPDLKLSDLTDIRQLEALVRAHILMAQMAGQNSTDFIPFCLLAYRLALAIWQVHDKTFPERPLTLAPSSCVQLLRLFCSNLKLTVFIAGVSEQRRTCC